MSSGCNILTVNSGSSSMKFSLYALDKTDRLVLRGELGRIGVRRGFMQVKDHESRELTNQKLNMPDHETALKTFFGWMHGHEAGKNLHAVGHRLVHGGTDHVKPQRVSPALMEDLKRLAPLAPDHLPDEIKALEAVGRLFPTLPLVACFDTAFHRCMPQVAERYALPGSFYQEGLRRFGFHGLSCEYILQELAQEAGAAAATGRIIVAHLGNGASMTAIEGGRSLDTTMGLTPTGGLVMSTRSGDLDPGVIIYLLQEKGMTPDAVNHLVNQQAGLLGTSGVSPDMQDLLAQKDTEPDAALAVDIFCYQARKFIGALAAALGGIDTFVFTGGIGENAAIIRERICEPLEFLGIRLDRGLNEVNSPVITRQDSPVTVRVMNTNEELMIARHTRDLIASEEFGRAPGQE